MALRVALYLLLAIVSPVLCRPTSIEPIVVDDALLDSPGVSPRTVTSTSAQPVPSSAPQLASANKVHSDEDSGGAAERDGSSGAVISAASIGSVALVVVACGGCFFLGKRRRRPGFHMPSVLVDIDTAREQPDSPSGSPTSVRPPWRDFPPKSRPESESDSSQEQYPQDGASNSRPPSYRSGKDPLYPPRPPSRSHDAPE